GVAGKKVAHFFHYIFGVFGPRALHKEEGGLVPRAHQFLERSKRHKKARALPVLHDSCDMPIVIEDPVRLSRLYFLCFRRNVVHKNVVGTFHIVSQKKHKSARDGSKALLINSVNDFYARCVELKKHGGDGLDVFQFCKLVPDFDGHGGAAKGEKDRRGWWLQHDVRPDAFNAPGRLGQQAAGQANDQDDERNFHGNSHGANQRAQGAVQQIAEDQLTHHGCLFSVTSPTRTNSAPAGGSSLNRSAGISSFKMTLVTCKSIL